MGTYLKSENIESFFLMGLIEYSLESNHLSCKDFSQFLYGSTTEELHRFKQYMKDIDRSFFGTEIFNKTNMNLSYETQLLCYSIVCEKFWKIFRLYRNSQKPLQTIAIPKSFPSFCKKYFRGMKRFL